MEEFAKDEIFSRNGGGVTFSGGEPLMQPEFLLEALKACGEEGYHRCVDTCGFVQKKVILDIARETDLFLYDVKHMDPAEHKKYTGVDNVVILENLKALSDAGAAINIRFPFMPGINTGDENVTAMAEMVSRLRGVTGVNILPYHTAAKGKHERWHMEYKLPNLMPPTANMTAHAQKIFESYGLKVTIGG
jgi:pyruvate formate lyase activating enzyme